MTLWHDYLRTQFDPAHLLSELGFSVFFDLIILYFAWGKWIKPRLTREIHQEIDQEHGVVHQEAK